MPRCHIVMPCAGIGQRALDARDPRQADCAKQYQVLAGQPMVMHTLLALTRVDVMRASAGTAAPGLHFQPDDRRAVQLPQAQVPQRGGGHRDVAALQERQVWQV